jgi:cytoskeletal protein CcmA (bactofilin family)
MGLFNESNKKKPLVEPVGPATSSHTDKSFEQVDTQPSLEARLVERFGRPRNSIDPKAAVHGRFNFDSPARIDGKLSGELNSSSSVVVGKDAEVNAQLRVSALIVIGRVKGEIIATERVEILHGGSVEGSISSPTFVIEEGCTFNGTCSMQPRNASTQIASASSDRLVATEVEEREDLDITQFQ